MLDFERHRLRCRVQEFGGLLKGKGSHNLARTACRSYRLPELETAGDRACLGKLALNCFVIEGGEIAVGDEVQLVRGRACTESAALTE